MELDNYYKVLCFSPPQTIQGLQRALDRIALPERRYRFFPGSLAKLASGEPIDCDFLFVSLDLGQPVPVENLKKAVGHVGLCAFVQPTPQQLLSVLELPDWSGIAWDGVAFERVLLKLDQLAFQHEEKIRERRFVESCQAWMRHNSRRPELLVLANPPQDWAAPIQFSLDLERRFLSVGAMGSRADVRLPLVGDKDLAELRVVDGEWSLKILQPELVRTQANVRALKPGDEIQVGNCFLQVRASAKVEEFGDLARRSGLPGVDREPLQIDAKTRTLGEVLREMMAARATGELRVSTQMSSGAIYLSQGNLLHAVTGAVEGEKALLRMLAWSAPAWRFNVDKVPPYAPPPEAMLDLGGFLRLLEAWSPRWNRLARMVPPAQMRLRVNIEKARSRKDWAYGEFLVLASVSEFGLVREIMTHCPLNDVDLFEILVEMRRQGVVEPVPVAR